MTYKKFIYVSVQCFQNILLPKPSRYGQYMKEKNCTLEKYTQPPWIVICHVGPSKSAAEFPSETWEFHSISTGLTIREGFLDYCLIDSYWILFCFCVSTACVSVSWLPWNVNIVPPFICQKYRHWNVGCDQFKLVLDIYPNTLHIP
jgi:hypothetical protein